MLTPAEIAVAADITPVMVYYILNGDRTPSEKLATKLESLTGVCREAWMWPTRHFNPYVQLCNKPSCSTCANRSGRIHHIMARAIAYLRIHAPDRWAGLQTVSDYGRMISGYDDTVAIVFLRITREGVTFVTETRVNPDLPPLKGISLTKEDMPWFWAQVKAQRIIQSSVFPDGLEAASKKFIEFLQSRRTRSILLIPGKTVIFSMVSTRDIFSWDSSNITATTRFIDELDDIFSEPTP